MAVDLVLRHQVVPTLKPDHQTLPSSAAVLRDEADGKLLATMRAWGKEQTQVRYQPRVHVGKLILFQNLEAVLPLVAEGAAKTSPG